MQGIHTKRHRVAPREPCQVDTTRARPTQVPTVVVPTLRPGLVDGELTFGPVGTAQLAALRAAVGPLGDLLYLRGNNLAELLDRLAERGPEIRQAAELKREFAEDFARCFRPDGTADAVQLQELAKRYGGRPLDAGKRTQLMSALIQASAFADALAVYDAAARELPGFDQWPFPRELYIVCLNKLGRTAESVRVALAYVRELAGDAVPPDGPLRIDADNVRRFQRLNGEVLGGLGRAFRDIAAAAAKGPLSFELQQLVDSELSPEQRGGPVDYGRAALEISTRYYEAGFLADFEYYPGINVVYNLYALGQSDLAERIARQVQLACVHEGGRGQADYWNLATQVELSLMLRQDAVVLELLPRALEKADAPWKLESTATRMAELAAARRARGEDARLLEATAAMLGELSRRPSLSLLPAELEALLAPLRPLAKGAAPSAAVPPATGTAAGRSLEEQTLSFRGLGSRFLGGSVAFGERGPERPVTRTSVELARAVLDQLELGAVSDPAEAVRRLGRWLERQLGLLDPVTSRRPLEDRQGPEREQLEAFLRNRQELAQAFRSGDSRTDLMVNLLLGRADGYDTGAGLALLAAVWMDDRAHALQREAYRALREGDLAAYEAHLAELSGLSAVDVRVGNFQVYAPVELDAGGRERVLPGDRRARAESFNLLETHAMPALTRDDGGGQLVEAMLTDPWYQQRYGFGALALDLSGWSESPTGRVDAGVLGPRDEQGAAIPVQLALAPSGGVRLRPSDDESGLLRFGGMELAPVGIEHFARFRANLDALASAIATMDLAGPKNARLRDMLSLSLDEVAQQAHALWLSTRAEELSDPSRPFLGFAPVTVRLDEALRSLDRAGLEARLGVQVSAQKHEAIRKAPAGTVLVDAAFRDWSELGVRERGEAAAGPLVTLLFLADERRGEDVERTLEALRSGADATGSEQLGRILQIAGLGMGMVLGERAWGNAVAELGPTGREATVAARTDFQSFYALTDDVAALDSYTLQPAAQWLLGALSFATASSGAELLEQVLREQIESAAADAHNLGWKRGKDVDFANPDNPFLGAGATRVRVRADTRAMSLDQLAALLGRRPEDIPASKFAAIARAPDGADLTHPLYRDYRDVLALQPDGGTRLSGANSVPLMVLCRYLTDFRGEEVETLDGLRRVVAGLLDGTDRRGLRQISVMHHMVFQAAQLVYGERGVAQTVPEQAPTGRTRKLPGRADFIGRGDSATLDAALDASALAVKTGYAGA